MIICQEFTGEPEGVRRDVLRMVWEGSPDDVASFFAVFFDEIATDDIALGVGVAAGDKAGDGTHSGGRFMEDAAGVRHPCAGKLRSPGGKQIGTLTAGGEPVEEKLVGADVINLFDLL